jgi:hypothetical protein
MRCKPFTSKAGDSTACGGGATCFSRYSAAPAGPPLRNAFIGPIPQAVTKSDRNTHGIHARTSAGRAMATLAAAAASAFAPGKSHVSAGFHHVQKSAREPSDTSPPMMSTSSGPT